MEQSAAFANAVLWELRFIHWLLIGLVFFVGLVVAVLIASHRSLARSMSVLDRQQEQTQFQQRMEDLLNKGFAKDALFAATETIASRPRDPYVYWYLGQANFQLKEFVKAKKAFSTAIELAPNWAGTAEPWLARVEEEIRNASPKAVN
jgi:cytochrome c-type biogenesis protein CcmH/NrfG